MSNHTLSKQKLKYKMSAEKQKIERRTKQECYNEIHSNLGNKIHWMDSTAEWK